MERGATLGRTILLRLSLFLSALFIFIISLQILRAGAASLSPFLTGLRMEGVINSLGFGWLGAYVILSGSPVAAMSLTLFSAQVTTEVETFAMVSGSRLGAAFAVLLIGFVYYLRGRGRFAGVFVGILDFLVTATIYLPAFFLGYLALQRGWLDRFQFTLPGSAMGSLNLFYEPLAESLSAHLPSIGTFLLGFGLLLGSFSLFDRSLPQLDPAHSRFREIAHIIYRPPIMFLFGSAITMLVPSVSVSLGLLVPFSARGYIRRENIIPYIMGANVATFSDTFVASLFVNSPRAFTIVFTQAASVAIISLLVILFLYRPYEHMIEETLESLTNDPRRLAIFIAVILLVPLILMAI